MKTWRFLILLLSSIVAGITSGSAAETRSMTLLDCIQESIAHNLGLKVARIGPIVAQNNLSLARAGYDPALRLSGRHDSARRGSDLDPYFLLPTPPRESEADSFSGGIGGLLPWGMTYDVSASANDSISKSASFDTNGVLVTRRDEASGGELRGTIRQPLLKNLWIDQTRLNVTLAKKQLAASREVYRQAIIDLVTSVENAYYDLVAARENVKVQQKGLELARKLLEENRERVEVGALAPLDEKQAESEVAAREADLLSAERTLALSENALKRALTDDYAQWHAVDLIPSDQLLAPVQLLDVQDSWAKGLTMRPDLIQAWLTMEERNIQVKFTKNQLFPQLDAFATYGYSGSDVNSEEFSDVFANIESGSLPFWAAGVEFSVPITSSGARARHRNARAQVEQSVLEMKNLEQQIMAEIDDAIKFAKVSYRSVNATRAAREYAEAALEAEQEKLANGKSTSFEVLRLQRDLTTARSSEISALTAYNKALAALAQREGTTLQRHRIDLESR